MHFNNVCGGRDAVRTMARAWSTPSLPLELPVLYRYICRLPMDYLWVTYELPNYYVTLFGALPSLQRRQEEQSVLVNLLSNHMYHM